MDWNNAPDEIPGLIARLRQDQREQVCLSEDAALVEMRALAAAERAHAIIDACHQRLRDDADEITLLLAEQQARA